jgi:hypothetical protein
MCSRFLCLSLTAVAFRWLCGSVAPSALTPPTCIPSICPGAHMGNAQIAPLGSCPWCQIPRQANPTATEGLQNTGRGRSAACATRSSGHTQGGGVRPARALRQGYLSSFGRSGFFVHLDGTMFAQAMKVSRAPLVSARHARDAVMRR